MNNGGVLKKTCSCLTGLKKWLFFVWIYRKRRRREELERGCKFGRVITLLHDVLVKKRKEILDIFFLFLFMVYMLKSK